jgi:hypothetical protein
MRKEKALAVLLHSLVDLVSDEAERNPEFAARVGQLLDPLPDRKTARRKRSEEKQPLQTPDVYAERAARGDLEFRLWLRDQPVAVLRAIVRTQDLDPARRTSKWKDAEKLTDFIADQIQGRAAKGASFLRASADP